MEGRDIDIQEWSSPECSFSIYGVNKPSESNPHHDLIEKSSSEEKVLIIGVIVMYKLLGYLGRLLLPHRPPPSPFAPVLLVGL